MDRHQAGLYVFVWFRGFVGGWCAKKSLMNRVTQCAVFFPHEINIVLTFIREK